MKTIEEQRAAFVAWHDLASTDARESAWRVAAPTEALKATMSDEFFAGYFAADAEFMATGELAHRNAIAAG